MTEHMTAAQYRVAALKATKEDDLLVEVVKYAMTCGWLVHHSRPARTKAGRWVTALMGHAGLPDLILVRPPIVRFVELKAERGTTSPAQKLWRKALEGCPGVSYDVWKPRDMDAIERALR